MTDADVPWQVNPFSSRFVRPGQLPFLFADGLSAQKLVEQLASQDGMGQLIGPHGSGKSTLLHMLRNIMVERGLPVEMWTLTADDSTIPVASAGAADKQLIVDGFEQLSTRQQQGLIRTCRKQRCGLLVSAHADVGLPTLLEVTPRLDTVREVVSVLTRETSISISDREIESAFREHAPDIRELLFALYDLVEQRRRS